MHFALNLPHFGPHADARLLADLARQAEDTGWDGFFIWDHVAMPEAAPVVDPWVALTSCAMRTSRIRLGTMVTPLPRRRPWKLARETASLDQLSGGRLTLGAGTGLFEQEFGDLGEESDPKARGDMLDEALEVLTGLWSGKPFSHEGRHYRLRDAHFLPPPSNSRASPYGSPPCGPMSARCAAPPATTASSPSIPTPSNAA